MTDKLTTNPPGAKANASLARQLLSRLLPAMLAMMIVGAALAYVVAHQAATRAYDRALLDNAQAVINQVKMVGGNLQLRLPAIAEQILLTDNFDQQYFEVVNGSGQSVAGYLNLPRPPATVEERPLYYDGWFDGKQVRIAAMTGAVSDTPFTVIVAETTSKRENLIREILLAMLIPELLLVLACIFLVRVGVRHGLSGIRNLREQLAHRSHADLRPLQPSHIPEELQPLLAETNDLLRRLELSIAAQRHLVADASHQLRTPIAALQAEAELALRSAEPRAGLEKIVAGARRLAHLAHQLLTLSRLDPAHLPQPRPIDLVALLQGAASRWMPFAIQRNADLGFDLAATVVTGEPVWLEELVTNLVDNALRYAPPGGVVTVRCGSRSGQAWLEVEDNGPGIPPAERERVFERFRRLPGNDAEGTGLGLSIVREVARIHGATVTIGDGANGAGTLIRVVFPAG